MKHKAITLLELIIVVSIFMLMVTAAMPRLVTGLYANQIEVAGQELVHVLRVAQSNSMDSFQDSSWGVYFDSAQYVLFVGDSYALRDTSKDLNYPLPGSVSFGALSLNGGGSEVVFAEASGMTSQYGTIDLDSASDPTQTVTVTRFGHVQKD